MKVKVAVITIRKNIAPRLAREEARLGYMVGEKKGSQH